MGINVSKIDKDFTRSLKADIARKSFLHFIKFVDPSYQFNWHHLQLIKALERLANREIKRLIVMMPPRHGKSQLVSRLFPAWCFARNQNEQVLLASYSQDLASSMSRDCKRILALPTFQAIFPDVKPADSKTKGQINTNRRFDIDGAKGYYFAAGVGGGITGAGATVAIIDDPVKNAEEADSATYRERAWDWYQSTFKTRFEPGCIQVVCQTRWHEDDLTGRILAGESQDTVVISLPAICESDEENRAIGDPLWEGKYNREELLKIQGDVGSRTWNALYQQRPAPQEGNLIKRAWFSRYDARKVDLKGKRVNFYVDSAYTDKERNDPTAIIAYFKEGADLYVVDCESKWLEFQAQIDLIKTFTAKNGYSPASVIRVEPKATGKTLVQVMKKQTRLNIREADAPKDSKVSRVNSISGVLESGRVYLPEGMTWVEAFLDECAAFPNARHDDRVDCLTGMVLSDTVKKGGGFK